MGWRSWFAPLLRGKKRDRAYAAAIAATALIAVGAVLIDKSAPHFAVSLQSPGLIGIAAVVSILGNPIVYFAPGTVAFLIFWLRHPHRELARKAFLIAASPFVAGLVVNFGKIVIGRPRPLLPAIHWHPFTLDHEFWSFPSEHAAVAAAGAAALSLLLPEYRLALFVVAGLVAGARLVMGMHYPTNLVAGFVLGLLAFFAVRTVVDWFDAWLRRHHPVSTHVHDRDREPPDIPF